MARYVTTVQAFTPGLGVEASLGALNVNTFALSAIGAPISATFEDADGQLGPGDTGVTTFNGLPVTFIGSGTMQFGVTTGGGLIGGLLGAITGPVFDLLGDPADVIVFEAGGQIYLILPDGPPDTLLGLDSLLVSFSLTDAPAMIPCFASGTLIRTPDGDLPIEDLAAGQLVLDTDGQAHRIIWTSARRVNLLAPRPDIKALRPVRIRANAFGPGRPYLDLVVSQQHRIEFSDPALEQVAGVSRGLCAAKHFIGDLAFVDQQLRQITYHHILCAQHVVMLANGLPAESLFLGQTILSKGFDARARQEIETLFPELLAGPMAQMTPALPFLRKRDLAAVLARR